MKQEEKSQGWLSLHAKSSSPFNSQLKCHENAVTPVILSFLNCQSSLAGHFIAPAWS